MQMKRRVSFNNKNPLIAMLYSALKLDKDEMAHNCPLCCLSVYEQSMVTAAGRGRWQDDYR